MDVGITTLHEIKRSARRVCLLMNLPSCFAVLFCYLRLTISIGIGEPNSFYVFPFIIGAILKAFKK